MRFNVYLFSVGTSGCHLLSTSDNGRYVATADHDSNIHIYGLKKKQVAFMNTCWTYRSVFAIFAKKVHFCIDIMKSNCYVK